MFLILEDRGGIEMLLVSLLYEVKPLIACHLIKAFIILPIIILKGPCGIKRT